MFNSRTSVNGPAAAQAAQNILLIRLKSIGDIIFTLPAVHVVRQNFPGSRITYLVSKEHAPLIEGFRDVNETLQLDRARYRRGNPMAVIRETLSMLRRLRRERFSLVVDFQGYGETAMLTRWTGARERWGIVTRTARGWAYTRGVKRDCDLHPVAVNLALVQPGGVPPERVRNEFSLPESALHDARKLFAAQGLDATRTALFIQPFTSSAHKDWPLANYLALAGDWRAGGLQVLFGGGPADRAALEPARAAGFPVYAGAPLLVAAGLMKLSAVVVGGDTGLLHLAVAMDKRIVMIMNSEARKRTHPFQRADWVVSPEAGVPGAGISTDSVRRACDRAFAELKIRIGAG